MERRTGTNRCSMGYDAPGKTEKAALQGHETMKLPLPRRTAQPETPPKRRAPSEP